MISKNKFCSIKELKNEAAVEALFINKLLEYLGFSGSDISFKESISEVVIWKGSKKSRYRPDYVIKVKNLPSIVIDAKSPSETIENWESQCSSYCLEINKNYEFNPVQYYILSNWLNTSVYQWDLHNPIISLTFDDFVDSSEKFSKFEKFLQKIKLTEILTEKIENLEKQPFVFKKITLQQLSSKFQKIHQEIWKNEKKAPSAIFMELLKIIFVKIQKDKELHDNLGSPNPMPRYKDVVFSVDWINRQTECESPINDLLFTKLVQSLERDILDKKKKRFFNQNEKIYLSPESLKKVVRELEDVDLYWMEEDIHWRMFEAFLDATVRGKDIGQFFTPRDVVDFMVKIADLQVSRSHVDSVLDACCWSGGFLISAFVDMYEKAKRITKIPVKEKEDLISRIKTQSIFGVDAWSDPAMYKIARMNMYLHWDGGSNIFYADSLDKWIGRVWEKNIEVDAQLDELRRLLFRDKKKFNVILSNPPFSLKYNRKNKEQGEVLNQYEIAAGSEKSIIDSLISSVMFIERYRDLVADDGHIIAIIDDSVLSWDSYSSVRNYLRDNFTIEAIISLPGDCFKRSSARVKTSILVLSLKDSNSDQENIFLASSVYLGIEEKVAKRIWIKISELEKSREEEIKQLLERFKEYRTGKKNKFIFPFSNCQDRLDVKFCIKDTWRKVSNWKKKGYKVLSLEKILTPAQNRSIAVKDDESYQLLSVNYDGDVQDGERLDWHESSYSRLYQIKEWDILISNMWFWRGAIGIVPPYHAEKFVSNEYTILRADSEEATVFYTNLLRTKEILWDVLSSATWMNRWRIKWEMIKNVQVPVYIKNDDIIKLTREIKSFWSAHMLYLSKRSGHVEHITTEFDVSWEDSKRRWLSFKPPE